MPQTKLQKTGKTPKRKLLNEVSNDKIGPGEPCGEATLAIVVISVCVLLCIVIYTDRNLYIYI